MDIEEEWSRPLHDVRADVKRTMSLGLHVRNGNGGDFSLAVYAGGWADLSLLAMGACEVIERSADLDTAEDVGPSLMARRRD